MLRLSILLAGMMILAAGALVAAALLLAPMIPAAGEVLFVSRRDDNREIYVMDLRHNIDHNLTYLRSDDYSPTWVMDGEEIAFISNRTGSSEIYVMGVNGRNLRRITYNNVVELDLSAPRHGSMLTYVAPGKRTGASPRNTDIFMIDLSDTSSTIQITDTVAREETPVISPDGEKIAFTNRAFGYSQVYTIALAAARSGIEATPVPSDARNNSYTPVWAPDGQRILFSAVVDDNLELHLVNDDGSGLERLTHHSRSDMFPAYSSDGEYVVFSSLRASRFWQLYLLDVASGEVRRLTRSGGDDVNPMWRP